MSPTINLTAANKLLTALKELKFWIYTGLTSHPELSACYGLCNNLGILCATATYEELEELISLRARISSTWKYHTGNSSYMVPDPDYMPLDDMEAATHEDKVIIWTKARLKFKSGNDLGSKYEGRYGELRIDLLDHMIKELESYIDNNS